MKRFIELVLLMSGPALLSACNPTTEFATFDPANAKDAKDKNNGLINSAEVSKESVHIDYVVNNSVELEKLEVTQIVQDVVTNLPGKDIEFNFYPDSTSDQAVQIRDVLSDDTITEIDNICDQVGQEENTYTTVVHDEVVVAEIEGDEENNNVCSESSTNLKKVDVCHKTPNHRQDIRVSINAIPAFSARGDFIGTCALQDLVTNCGGLGVNLTTKTCNAVAVELDIDDSICPTNTNSKKVAICHKTADHWQNITVSVNAINAHSAHGDFIGTCAVKDLIATCAGSTVNLTTMTCQ